MRGAQRWKLTRCAACLSVVVFLAGCGSHSAGSQADQLAQALQERENLQMRLARMEQRLASLEQTQNELTLAQARQSSGQTAAPAAPQWGGAPAQPYRPENLTPVPLVSGDSPPARPAAPSAARSSNRAPAVPEAYQRALSLLLDQNKPEESRTAFSVFLTDNPDGPFTPNALYWVGETYYAEKKYDDAILLFKDVAARFPKHDKAPDALLKGVLSYRQLSDRENAAYLEKLLLDDYPNSRAVGILRQRSSG